MGHNIERRDERMNKESKICPLFFASPVNEIELECRPDRCAWAHDGGCALVTIARCLDGLNEHGIIVWPESEQ